MSLANQLQNRYAESDIIYAVKRMVDEFMPVRPKYEPPDLAQFASEHGIRVRQSESFPFEGMIERDIEGRATISIRKNARGGANRARFTFAHELGHWMLQEAFAESVAGRAFRGLSSNPAELHEEESLADLLAAEMLAPIEAVKAKLAEPGSSAPKIVQYFTSVCAVSQQVAMRRVSDALNKPVIRLFVLPRFGANKSSRAVIDSAIIASPRSAICTERDGVRFLPPQKYSYLWTKAATRLELETPFGNRVGYFEMVKSSYPLEHLTATAVGIHWN